MMADTLAKALDPAAGVIEAQLKGLQLTDEDCKSIVAFLGIPECKIQLLNLSNNLIGDAGAIDIATALKTNKTLVNMNLSQNQIGDPGAGELADMLEKNTTLKLLNLRANIIQREGYDRFMDVLEINTTLKKIMLEFNQISAEAEASA